MAQNTNPRVRGTQSDSPLADGRQPQEDKTGWPEGPDGVRRPRKVFDEREIGTDLNHDVAEKQLAGEWPKPKTETAPVSRNEAGEEVEENDEEGKPRRKKKED